MLRERLCLVDVVFRNASEIENLHEKYRNWLFNCTVNTYFYKKFTPKMDSGEGKRKNVNSNKVFQTK